MPGCGARSLFAVPLVLALPAASRDLRRPDIVLVIGLALFGLPFAVNSSLHSYLILAYAGSRRRPKMSASTMPPTPPAA